MSVYCVLLNWNGFRDTIECLTSLLPGLKANCGVIVCDNASSDGSAEEISKWALVHAPEWELIALGQAAVAHGVKPSPNKIYLVQNNTNMGFAGGNNVGIRLALNDLTCKYVWLLNNDTTVDANSLSAVVARAEEDATIGLCGSTLIYHHNQEMVQAMGGSTFNRFTGRSKHIGAFTALRDVPINPAATEQAMSYVVGAAMLVRRDYLEQVGLMQEDYFLYYEEIDWCTRGKGKFRLGYAPDSHVFHKEGASIGTAASGGSALSVYYLFRSRVRFTARFYPGLLGFVLAACAWDVFKFIVKRKFSLAQAATRGVLHLPRLVPEKRLHK